MINILSSYLLLGILLFLFSVIFPPLDALTTIDLSAHMLQHFLVITSGAIIAYSLFSKKQMPFQSLVSKISIIVIAIVLAYWHLPSPWDSAVLNPAEHVIEHTSFLFAGLLIGAYLIRLSDSQKVWLSLLAFFGHMVYAAILLIPSYRVYPLYSVDDQYLLGTRLLLGGPLLLIGAAYIIARNPHWLGLVREQSNKIKPRGRSSLMKSIAFAVNVSIILTSSIYSSAIAISLSAPHSANGVIVYIIETPFSWQFSPQSVKVVIGINNTVTWISRSVSYDTVTSIDGSFNSGPIPPGGKFTYTFERPGLYKYYCMYHPWMVGQVLVI